MSYKNYEMMFDRKGYGRIFVEKEKDIIEVETIMMELDPDEFEGYYPKGLVTVFSEENFKSIYVGKFDDMNIGEVLKIAWNKGIHCFALFGRASEYEHRI